MVPLRDAIHYSCHGCNAGKIGDFPAPLRSSGLAKILLDVVLKEVPQDDYGDDDPDQSTGS